MLVRMFRFHIHYLCCSHQHSIEFNKHSLTLVKVAVKFVMVAANLKSSSLLMANNYLERRSLVLTFIMFKESFQLHFSYRQLCFDFMAFLDLVQVQQTAATLNFFLLYFRNYLVLLLILESRYGIIGLQAFCIPGRDFIQPIDERLIDLVDQYMDFQIS